MTSKFVIDVAKIKEERKQYASKLEVYNKIKLKRKRVQPIVKFDELKKFKALEEIVHEPSIPVEEYGEPTGLSIIDPNQYQCVWNATSAFKKTIHRKGQSNLKISNILKFTDYDKEEKQSIGSNLLSLMSTSLENSAECRNILDQWVSDWHPTYLQVCAVFENLGVDIKKELGKDYHLPENYQKFIESTKIEYSEFNSKVSSTKQSEINSTCLINVLTYMKSIVEYLSQDELQSILILFSSLSLDKHCMELREIYNELLNQCLGILETKYRDKILKTLYMKIENSMYQCYFVNKVLKPCTSQCKMFVMELSYLFMCNLLYNHDLTVQNNSLNTSNNNHSDVKHDNDTKFDVRNLRSKRKLDKDKIPEAHSSPKKLQLSKTKSPKKLPPSKGKTSTKEVLLDKTKSLFEKENSKLHNVKSTSKSTKKLKGKLLSESESPKQVQRSILDYLKRKDKSPDLLDIASTSEASTPTHDVKEEKHPTDLESVEGRLMENGGIPNTNGSNDPILGISDESLKPNLDEILASCDQRELIFRKYKPLCSITFPILYQRIRNNLQEHIDSPIRIYRIVSLLNNIVELIVIDESNMSMCKLLMKELSHVQYKYNGLHDMHRHLVCVYLQQYTTMWGACINRIQYRINQRNEEYNESD